MTMIKDLFIGAAGAESGITQRNLSGRMDSVMAYVNRHTTGHIKSTLLHKLEPGGLRRTVE